MAQLSGRGGGAFMLPLSGRLTQLGECHLDKVEVVGSSPISPTIFFL